MALEFKYFDVDQPSRDRATIQLWDGDDLLGAIFLRKQSLLPDDPDPYTPCWQVAGIDVIERFRRRGFGTKLYEEAARQAARHGMSLCSDTPDDVSSEALAFWEKQVAKGRAFWEVPGPADREGFNYDYGRFVLKLPIAPSLGARGMSGSGIKMDILRAATDFLYSKKGPDYGEFGGCGDTVMILLAVAKELALKDIELQYGNAYFSIEGKADPNAHAWLLVDGKIFDPSRHAHKFRVIRYDAWTPERAEEFQSDLLECIVGFDSQEIEEWKNRTLEALMRGGLPDLKYDLPDVNRLFFISPGAFSEIQKLAVHLIWYLYSSDKGGQVEEYGMWDSGGCWTLAQALRDWLGPGAELYWVVGRDPHVDRGIGPQHVVVRIGSHYLDGNGIFTKGELLDWWNVLEQYEDLSMKPFSAEEAARASIHCKTVMRDRLVEGFERYLGEAKL